MDKIIDGKMVSSIIKENLKKEISSLDEKLTLVVIQVGNNEASNIYVNKKIKLCNEMGINSIYKKYDDIDEENLIPKPIYNFSKFFENLQNDFWQWVKTLPNYDPEILYSITLIQHYCSINIV